jgi:hypothetical protein
MSTDELISAFCEYESATYYEGAELMFTLDIVCELRAAGYL